MIDQDEAAKSAGERGEGSRECVREAGPPRREEGWAVKGGDRGYWEVADGGQRVLHWCVQCVQQAAMLVERWTSGLGSKPEL